MCVCVCARAREGGQKETAMFRKLQRQMGILLFVPFLFFNLTFYY